MEGVTYPNDVQYAIEPTGYSPRSISGSSVIYTVGTAFDMYLDLAHIQYSASINNIQYTISREGNSFTYNTLSDLEDASNWDPQN
jgi:hypothetical protein